MTTRRLFLSGILAAGAAPAIVRAGSLMKIAAPTIWVPPTFAWGPPTLVSNPLQVFPNVYPSNRLMPIKEYEKAWIDTYRFYYEVALLEANP